MPRIVVVYTEPALLMPEMLLVLTVAPTACISDMLSAVCVLYWAEDVVELAKDERKKSHTM